MFGGESANRWLNLPLSLFELTRSALIFLVAVAALIALIGFPVFVRGSSMEPNFRSGELVIVERVSYLGNRTIKRGDVVAVRFPADPKRTRLIKRVIGLPKERVTVKRGAITINGELLNEKYHPRPGEPPYDELEEVTLKTGEYFLAGDNRPSSSDSRLWGPVLRQDILGRVSFVIYPLSLARFVD